MYAFKGTYGSTAMELSLEAIHRYQELRHRYHGDNLTIDQAKLEALELLRLMIALQGSDLPVDDVLERKD